MALGFDLDTSRLHQINVRLQNLSARNAIHGGAASALRSMVYEQLGQRTEAESEARAALKKCTDQADDSIVGFLNAVSVLFSFGNYEEGLTLMGDAVTRWPLDADVRFQAVELPWLVGQFDLTITHFNEIDQVHRADVKLSLTQKMVDVIQLKRAAEELHFTQEDILARLLVSRRAVRDFGYEVRHQRRKSFASGEFITRYYIKANHEQCAECNLYIYDELNKNFENTGLELFSIVCHPVEMYLG
ncbi:MULTISPECIES: M48 family metallopeptidase [unclassified Duganella]|uniref:tetratricopeptide repeat protein n=1 Tax=unclassified Duganella TaxID=2636909 RepID=UPI00088AFA01|nr:MULTISPECIES: hypothetical protein [unclassified Duganella]SDF80045.1 hypothetical protein SAMN05216320_1011363 [Duganella sp. OV458]SDI49131.1 hypothetical protein SAMN05428973_10152 [Duganella sp. OV510]